jgi:3-dehydroquinate dehydratase
MMDKKHIDRTTVTFYMGKYARPSRIYHQEFEGGVETLMQSKK